MYKMKKGTTSPDVLCYKFYLSRDAVDDFLGCVFFEDFEFRFQGS